MFKSWNKKSYSEFVEYLKSIEDIGYKKFHSSLVLNSKYKMIGIRMPLLRKIANDISKTNIDEFLNYEQDNYYEEVMIEGLVISHIKDESMFYSHFKKHINKIDNWALCDSFCNSIKIVRKYEEKYFKESITMALSKKEFISRIGLVMILSHFIKEDNLNEIFNTLDKIESDKFYVNMASSWLICEIYIKYPKRAKEYLKNNKLNKFTQNKAISKINDSYRVSKEEKNSLKKYRR